MGIFIKMIRSIASHLVNIKFYKLKNDLNLIIESQIKWTFN